MEREPGFYWVRGALTPDWEICKYFKVMGGFGWEAPGCPGIVVNDESEFDEIDERRIVRDVSLAEIKYKKEKYIKMLEDTIDELDNIIKS